MPASFDLSGWLAALRRERALPGWGLAIAWTVVVLAYFYRGVIPAFNADDIIQMQDPNDAHTYLTVGRWGYWLIDRVLLHVNPEPLVTMLLGATLLVASGLVAARVLELRLAAATAAFLLVGAISAYAGDLFAYHSTRLPVPVGNLLALLGLAALLRRRWVAGVLLLALAPGFYPATPELAAVVLVGWAIRRVMRPGGMPALAGFAGAGAGMVVALALYLLATRAVSPLFGIELSGRVRMDPLALLHRLPEIVSLLRTQSLPFLAFPAGLYLQGASVLAVTLLFAGFLAVSVARGWREGGARAVAAVLALNAALLVAPWCLILASGGGETAAFAPRALYALSTVHAIWAATLLEETAGWRPPAFAAALAACLLLVLGSVRQINGLAFDQYLASQSDILATNRIIARIDDLLADTPGARTDDVPIAVIYDRPTLAGPRGEVQTARFSPWSREYIFRLVDRRFHWVSPDRYAREWLAARDRPEWPARGSVFLDDGVVVVVVTK